MSGVMDDTRRRARRNGVRQTRSPRSLISHPARWLMAAALVALACALPSISAFAQVDEPLADVRIEGNVSIPGYAILRHIKTSPNRSVNQQQVREDVRQLYSTRWFLSVEPRFRDTEDGTILTFKVVERPIVRRVAFVGNRKVKDKFLKAWTGLEVGSAYDVNANRESVRRIIDRYKEKGHAKVQVELVKGDDPDDREVVFKITEGPIVRVSERRIHGAKWVSSARVKTQLVTKQMYLVPLGGRYDPDTKEADIQALTQYYQKFGFLDVNVRAEESFSKDGSRVRFDYFIEEGPRFRIRNIEIVGNRVIETDSLQKDFKLHEGDYFEANKIGTDVKAMKDKYGDLGRLMAHVDAVPRYLEEKGLVDLVYRVDESNVNYVRSMKVHLDGDYPHTKRTVLLDRSLIAPGDLANPRLITKTKRRLEGSGLFASGPGELRIDVNPVAMAGLGLPGDGTVRGQIPRHKAAGSNEFPKPLTAPGHSTVHVESELPSPLNRPLPSVLQESTSRKVTIPFVPPMKESRPQSLAPAPFRSTGHTQPKRSEMPGSMESDAGFETTSIYAPTSEQTVFGVPAEDTVVRGQNLDGPFRMPNNPIYDNSPLGDPYGRSIREPPPGWVDLDIYASEARTGRMMFGVGVNSDAGVVGNIVIDESNFDLYRWPGSWSDIVDGRAWRGGGQRFRVEAVPGNQVSRYLVSWTDPYFLHTDYSVSLSGFYFNRFYDDWRENRLGGRVGLGKQLTPYWSISSAFRFEEVELEDPRTPTPASLASLLGKNTLITGQVSATHDTRDAPILPGGGHFAQISYEQAFGDFDYPRFEGEWRQYFTTYMRPDGSGRQVFSLTGNVGWSGDDTPIFERFYAGGFQTFRGFSFRGVTPRNLGVGTGGTFSFLGSAEYRVPVTANDMIQMVAFSDFGTIEENESFDNFRLSVGAGIRLTIPQMGPVPLAFDFAYPILREDFDERQVFSFYVGINR